MKSFERYVVEFCEIAPIRHVALLLSIGWDTVKEIFKDHLEHRLSKRKLGQVRDIAIDETRRDIARDLYDTERQCIKGSRFILLKGMENLSKNGFDRSMDLPEINEPLYRACILKEDLRMFWAFDNEKSGRPGSIVFPAGLFNNIIDLHHDPAGRNHHYMQLDCADFLIANASFSGHAKELFYSWIASKSHCCGDFYQMGRFLIKDAFVFN